MAIVIDGDGTVSGISVGGLPDGIVDAGTLATGAVETAKLNDDAVTSVKIADDAVVEAKIGASAVVTAALNDDAVTNAKVAANAVDEAQLAAGAVVTGKIEDGTIVDADVANVAASKLTGALPAISGASLTSLPGPTAATMPSGSIIGMKQAWMRGTQTISTSSVDVTDGSTALSLTSTNTAATKFLISANIFVGGNADVGCYFWLFLKEDSASWVEGGSSNAAHSTYGGGGSSVKNFMTYCAGDNDSWNLYTGSHASQQYLVTPSFSTSFSAKIVARGYSGNHYIGRMANHNNSASWSHSAPSSLTMYEIK